MTNDAEDVESRCGEFMKTESASESGFRVGIFRSPHKKCERCWYHDSKVSEVAEYPGICGRCASVLKREEIKVEIEVKN